MGEALVKNPPKDVNWTSRHMDRHVRPRPGIDRDDILDLVPTAWKVLDFGCGFGRLAEVFSGHDYTGTDIAEHRLAKAAKDYPSARFLKVDELVSSGEEFDVVVCADVLMHLNNEDVAFEMSRLGERTTAFVVCEHMDPRFRDGTFSFHRSPEWYSQLFQGLGFPFEEARAVNDPKHGPSFRVARYLNRLIQDNE
jgi:ubiquinone/menaquinone biosynthesis C-methylase UbiE